MKIIGNLLCPAAARTTICPGHLDAIASIFMNQKKKLLRRNIVRKVRCQYLVFLPKDYDQSKKKWPLILFLHGSGERGADLNKVKRHGVAKVVEQSPDFPFIVVSPQCPEGVWWSTEMLAVLLDEIEKNYRVDKKRIYVTGLSMGGFGTWQLAIENPDRFAAIAPICGGGNSHLVPKIKHLPVWVFHGAKDEIVPIEESREMVRALRKAGGRPKFTIYPRAKHDSWTEAYENKQLYQWFLKHQRGS